VENNFRFPGQYYDGETGANYNGFRYYKPDIGRYITADPIGLKGGINVFSYAENMPTGLIDPLGLCTSPCRWAKVMGLDDGHIAGVVCCDGRKYTCIWVEGGAMEATNPVAMGIIDDCTKQHEKDHYDDIDCPKTCNSNSGSVSRPGFRVGKDQNREERHAFQVECNCLKNSAKRCHGNAQCINEINREAQYVCKKAKSYPQ